MAGANLIYGVGQLGTGVTVDYGQLVMDNDLIGLVKYMLKGVPVNDETLALDVIREVGIGGTFIDRNHTVTHMREEHFFPDLFNRDAYETWKKKGATSLEERARERLEEILSQHYPPEPVVNGEIEKTLGEIYREAAASTS